jgi:hypothetical protein
MNLAKAMMLISMALLGACAGATDRLDSAPVTISLANHGTEAIDCRLMFGHWVDRDLGTLSPGDVVEMAVEQQPSDGGLFVMRPDGHARMMIETILCGQYPDWPASVGQVDLAPARRQPVAAIAASCGRPPEDGRIACRPVELNPAP